MRTFFGVNWENPQLYHLVLNTGCVPVDTCIRVVRLLTDDPAFEANATSHGLLADKLIEARVQTVLSTSGTGIESGINIAVTAGHVVLSGVAGPGGELANVLAMIRNIDGVKDVDNRLRRNVANYGV